MAFLERAILFQVAKKKAPPTAYERAIRYLAKRSHSRKELAVKLSRNYDEPEVKAALQRAEAHGYLDDRQYALQRALLSRLHKNWGDRRIALDLEQHEIAQAVISEALETAAGERPESVALQSIVDRWVESKGAPRSLSRLKKLHDRCQRLGFPPDAIRQLLSPYFRMMSRTENPQDGSGDELKES